MSAFGIATGSRTRPSGIEIMGGSKPADFVLSALGALVKWIPAEVVVVYAGAVAANQPAPDSGEAPFVSWQLWVICLVATPLYILVIAWATGKGKNLVWKAVLSIPAFALWTATIPFSLWTMWKPFTDQTGWFLGGIVILAGLLTVVAQKLAPPED